MKLVIDIPDEMYQKIKEETPITYGSGSGILVLHTCLNAIKIGTPLSKGHGALKDADIYKAEVNKYITENKNSDDLYLAGCSDGAYHALHTFNCIPTIIKADEGEEDEI